MAGASPIADLALDHLHPLHSQHSQPVGHTNAALGLHLLHDDVQQNECPCATHSCTAVHQQWQLLRDGLEFADVSDEGNERHDIVGHSVIRPGCVVQVSDCHVL